MGLLTSKNNMWLGNKKGYLQDWLTQLWVKYTGRRIDKEHHKWLLGPFGQTKVIDSTFTEQLIAEEGLAIHKNRKDFGLLNSIEELQLEQEERQRLNQNVQDFYEHTINYDFEVWSSWCGFFYPFGWLLNILFSKRLQQLNLPLNPLDAAKGIQSNIWKLLDKDNHPQYTIWYRILKSNKNVIYSGVYSTTYLPSHKLTCLKVAFPLPNGNATVVMKPKVLDDGSLLLISEGEKFGDTGFYFLLTNHQGKYWVKYVKAMHETIRVFEDEEGILRTDHILKLRGATFLKLHYKIIPKTRLVGIESKSYDHSIESTHEKPKIA